MSSVAINYPSGLMKPEEQTQVIQKAFQDLAKAHNSFASAPAVLLHLPSSTDAVLHEITSATPVNIQGYSWTINSKGGLVCFEASLNGSISISDAIAPVSLLVDGKTVLTSKVTSNAAADVGASSWSVTFIWKAVLGAGQHTLSMQGSTNAGTLRINGVAGTDRGVCTSAVSIIEFPQNVADVNVKAS